MRRFLSVAIFVSAVLSGASAQPRVQAGGTRFNTNLVDIGSSYLLAPSVQKELKIPPATAKKIQDKFMSSFAHMTPNRSGQGSATADRAKMIQDLRKSQAEIIGMLSPAQKSRLKQIVLQQMGASGMLHPEVKASLKITPDEERKINAIVRDGMQAMFAGLKGNTPGGNTNYQQQVKEMQAKQNEWRIKMTNMALKELTPAQRSQWQAMCGKPFTLDYSGMANMFGGRGGMTPNKRGG